jgi:hypothetical protein
MAEEWSTEFLSFVSLVSIATQLLTERLAKVAGNCTSKAFYILWFSSLLL